jgi:hypothetical protein
LFRRAALFLGWTVFPLVLVYWLESVVIGGFNVAKLLVLDGLSLADSFAFPPQTSLARPS